jgi:anti-anti-sigma regulatory factor
MKLTLMPVRNDNVIRVRSEGSVSRRSPEDPLQTLLGPHCYTHKVLLNVDQSQGIDTSGVCWLVSSHKRFAQVGGKLVLYDVPPVVLDFLNFLRLTPMLHIAANEQAACEMVLSPARETVLEERATGPAIRFPR